MLGYLVPVILGKAFKSVHAASKYVPSRGWGDSVEWTSLDQATTVSRKTNKPIMLIVHSMSCETCRDLKKTLAKHNPDWDLLSSQFVMVNALENEVNEEFVTKTGGKVEAHAFRRGPAFAPDGDYVPRIMFYHPGTWQLRNDLQSPAMKDNKKTKFLYTRHYGLVANMKKCLDEW